MHEIQFRHDLACVMLAGGVLLLMFMLGLDPSLRKLRALGAGVMFAAAVEVGLMLWIGVEAGRLAGLTARESLFLGGMICFSSTMIAMRTVADRGWHAGFSNSAPACRVDAKALVS